jgi:hypothetical protein
MKKVFSTMMILMAMTMFALTGLAGAQHGKPEPKDPPEKEPYIYINMGCSAVFQNKTSPVSLNEPAKWYFHGYVKNTTGKVLPKNARIEYHFSSNKPGYFQTNSGGVPSLSGITTLKEPLGINAQLYVTGMTFVTTKSPVQIAGTAQYRKNNF